MTERIQGSGASQLVQLIRQYGYNKDIDIELATVTSVPPNLKVKVDNMKIELEGDDLIVFETLLEHTRTVSINGGEDSTMLVKSPLQINDRVAVANVNNGQTYIVLDKVVTV